MPKRIPYDNEAIERLAIENERVVTHAQLMELGMPRNTICYRMRLGGPWQRGLPGVTICHNGTPTWRERLLAALRYGGPGTIITGGSGLREHGVRERLDPRVHILVPQNRSRTSHHFVVVERTWYQPDPVLRRGLPIAPLPRCCVDACRRDVPLARVRGAIAEVVQRNMCPPAAVRAALETLATQRSAMARRVLREIDAGLRSVAECNANDALRKSDIPLPEWNVALYTPSGEFLCIPDGWWEDLALALQIDSMQWHLSPALYKRTQATQRVLAELGIPFLPWAPGDVTRDPKGFVASVRDFRSGNSGRPRPELVVVRQGRATA